MSYTPSLADGDPAAGFNFPPDATGGQGLLSAIALELQMTNRALSETALTLESLGDIKRLLQDISDALTVLIRKA